MQLKKGAEVYAANDEKIGAVDGIVIDPKTKEIAYILVARGWILKTDKLLPISPIESTSEDEVRLNKYEGDFDELPNFEETHYIPIENDDTAWATSMYWYPPVRSWMLADGLSGAIPPNYVPKTKRNIPEGMVPLGEGAHVISSDGEHVGNVEKIFTDEEGNRVTHLLIKEGFLFPDKRVIPTSWLVRVRENEIHLTVDSNILEKLPEYQQEG